MGTPAIYPGEHLGEELSALDMSASAEFWLNLQKFYEFRLADERAEVHIDSLLTLKSNDRVRS